MQEADAQPHSYFHSLLMVTLMPANLRVKKRVPLKGTCNFKYNSTENLKSDNPWVVVVAREGQQPLKPSAMAQFQGLLGNRGRQPSEIKHDSLILGGCQGSRKPEEVEIPKNRASRSILEVVEGRGRRWEPGEVKTPQNRASCSILGAVKGHGGSQKPEEARTEKRSRSCTRAQFWPK